MEQQTTRDLSALGTMWAEATAEDVSGLVGGEVALTGPTIEEVEANGALGRSGTFVYAECIAQDDSGAAIGILAPLRAAQVLASLQLGKPADDFRALQSGPFENAVADAYREVVDLFVGILGRVLSEEASLPALRCGEVGVLEAGSSGDVAKRAYRRARFSLESKGFPEERVDILFEAGIAAEWFGAAPVRAGAEGSEESSEDADANLGPVAVLDPSAESRDQLCSLADALAVDVVPIDPVEFGDDVIDELEEVGAVVVEWDLGGRSGLEVLERLRKDDRTRDLRIALASSSPTRAMVEAAMRWGAHTFLFKPYEAAEVVERLLRKSPDADAG